MSPNEPFSRSERMAGRSVQDLVAELELEAEASDNSSPSGIPGAEDEPADAGSSDSQTSDVILGATPAEGGQRSETPPRTSNPAVSTADGLRPSRHPWAQAHYLAGLVRRSTKPEFPILPDDHPLVSGADGGAARRELQEFYGWGEAMSDRLLIHPVTIWRRFLTGGRIHPENPKMMALDGYSQGVVWALSALHAAREAIEKVSP